MNKTSNTERAPKQSASFYGRGKNRYAIYPDYWKKEWGQKPLLGHVWADDEFYAVREAYNKGLLTVNVTFDAEAVKVPFKPTQFNNKEIKENGN